MQNRTESSEQAEEKKSRLQQIREEIEQCRS